MTPTPVQVAYVHDGDGIILRTGEEIRIAGIDAPEVRGSPRCTPKRRRQLARSANPPWCDYALGERSKATLRMILSQGRVTIERTGAYSYRRAVARVYINGREVAPMLVAYRLARWWR